MTTTANLKTALVTKSTESAIQEIAAVTAGCVFKTTDTWVIAKNPTLFSGVTARRVKKEAVAKYDALTTQFVEREFIVVGEQVLEGLAGRVLVCCPISIVDIEEAALAQVRYDLGNTLLIEATEGMTNFIKSLTIIGQAEFDSAEQETAEDHTGGEDLLDDLSFPIEGELVDDESAAGEVELDSLLDDTLEEAPAEDSIERALSSAAEEAPLEAIDDSPVGEFQTTTVVDEDLHSLTEKLALVEQLDSGSQEPELPTLGNLLRLKLAQPAPIVSSNSVAEHVEECIEEVRAPSTSLEHISKMATVASLDDGALKNIAEIVCEVAGFSTDEALYVTDGSYVEYDANSQVSGSGFLIELMLADAHVSIRSNFKVAQIIDSKSVETALSRVLQHALSSDADYRARLELLQLRIAELHIEAERRAELLHEALESQARMQQKFEVASSRPDSAIAVRIADMLSDALTAFVCDEEVKEANMKAAVGVKLEG